MPKTLCLNPHCRSPHPFSRGLCASCYHAARRLVLQKQTTWRRLEAAGTCLPKNYQQPPSPRTRWFIQQSQRSSH